MSIPHTVWSHNSTAYMEARLEYRIAWAINPFVYNPYQKQRVHGSGNITPTHDASSPIDSDMITVQQMHVVEETLSSGKRRTSLGTNAMSKTEHLSIPKASYAELFYDLFFVTSLTSFGIKHEITEAQAIASYVAFFTVLW
jgi:hypothetical protein